MTDNENSERSLSASRRDYLKVAAAAGLIGSIGVSSVQAQEVYDETDASRDSFWYSQYNADSVVLSENGVQYPRSEGQQAQFEDLRDQMRDNAGLDERPIRGLNSLTIVPYRDGVPSYTERPVFNPRPIQNTLLWEDQGDPLITPQSLGWSTLTYLSWSRGFDTFTGRSMEEGVGEFYQQMYGFAAQWALNYGFLQGGTGVLRNESREEEEDENELYLFQEYDAENDEATGGTEDDDVPLDYATVLWTLSEAADFANSGEFGYENPQQVVDADQLQELADNTARTVFGGDDPEISADEVLQKDGPRGLGIMLGAVAHYGAKAAGDDDLESQASAYANNAASLIIDNIDDDGRVADTGGEEQDEPMNQAALQGAVGQGLLWATEGLSDVDHQDTADDVIDYLLDELWDPSSGTFDDELEDDVLTFSARDLGDIIGGINAADAVLDRGDVDNIFSEFFNNTVNRARLQRAERTQSRDPEADFPLPLPADAGDEEFGQAPVLNTEVQYDPRSDQWEVTDDLFTTEQAMYTANQLIWVGEFDGQSYPGSGVPGQTSVSRRRDTDDDDGGVDQDDAADDADGDGNETTEEPQTTMEETPAANETGGNATNSSR
ncbi:hypothetical protein [Halostella sp. PRR32]|uniref:hypothetical protein n=1 Tax=Halostella sp. PRR32 TaxID=3098147 RepID=UPI002B1D4AE9|nr:hypothetical protein [Halostella sp. PRR32]